MRVSERIEAWGHVNVTAKNRTTFEVTKENHLTRRGDCIIAINASKGAQDLSDEFKQLARRGDARITVIIEAGASREVAVGRGDPRLTLSHTTDLVARKSSYTCDRTLMVEADRAAADLSRDLIKEVQKSSQRVMITLIAEV